LSHDRSEFELASPGSNSVSPGGGTLVLFDDEAYACCESRRGDAAESISVKELDNLVFGSVSKSK
jgi:hypothetical protein